jgi:RHS repeat-associated protein
MDNSYISHYLYDAQGNRLVKTGEGNENVYLNALLSGGSTSTSDFTAYVNPYLEVSPAGRYTKHFFIGNERVVSKLGDLESYGSDPRRIEYAGHEVEGVKIDYKKKYETSIENLKKHYASFGMTYYGKDNDDYVNGKGFCCGDKDKGVASEYSPSDNIDSGNVGVGKEAFEEKQYYYHADYIGSTLLLTNFGGAAIQFLEYLPFGEPFFDIRKGDWFTRYLFHGKEYDSETGLYYYDGRYYDPASGTWLNVSSPFDRNTALTPYIFKNNNPGK